MTEKKTDTAPAKQESKFEISKKLVQGVADKVAGFVKSGQLDLPKDYSPENAMKSAWLILQETVDRNKKPVLESCTQASIANALLNMVVQGINPSKKQAYFIAYGNVLTFFRSYFGSMAVTKTVEPKVAEFAFAVVYTGDEFEYEIVNGKKFVTKHKQSLKNIGKDRISGAYCMALDENGQPFRCEIMTFEEIKQSWKQSPMKPINDKGEVSPTSTHGKFPADMAIRTVTNKVCKYIVNASDDSSIKLKEAFGQGLDEGDEEVVRESIEQEANTGDVLEIPHEAETEEAPETPQEEKGDPLDPPAEPNRPIGEPDGKMPGF